MCVDFSHNTDFKNHMRYDESYFCNREIIFRHKIHIQNRQQNNWLTNNKYMVHYVQQMVNRYNKY